MFVTKKFCNSIFRSKNKNLINFQQRNIKFIKRVVDEQTNIETNPNFDKEEASVQVFDLSGADLTEDSLKLEVIQSAGKKKRKKKKIKKKKKIFLLVDKLSKKQEILIKNVDKLSEVVAMMSTSIEVKNFFFINNG